MGRIVGSFIFPHPPIIVPEIGMGRENEALQTLKAVEKAAEDIKSLKPDTIIVITPHGPVFEDYLHISPYDNLSGDFGKFGAGNIKMTLENDTALVTSIIEHANNEDIPCGGLDDSLVKKYGVSSKLDHGALVPLYFIKKQYPDFKIVHISIAGFSGFDLYRFGTCIKRAVTESDTNAVIIASGDLSHRLTHDAPYGYSERGHEFDQLTVKLIRETNAEGLLDIKEDLCETAGECGLRSFIIMFGALDGLCLNSSVYSYEGPFGVGYCVARIDICGEDDDRRILKKMASEFSNKIDEIRANEDPYVALARKSLETYVKEDQILKVPQDLPDELIQNTAGAFVSIKKHGQLRGCIGTTGPTRNSIAEEIIYNAISSGTRDPRFYPVEANELDSLVYSVDVLMEPEPITSIGELDVIKYGVIVRKGRRSGLLLPNLEGVDTPQKQLEIALSKAGISPHEDYTMERFEVIRHR